MSCPLYGKVNYSQEVSGVQSCYKSSSFLFPPEEEDEEEEVEVEEPSSTPWTGILSHPAPPLQGPSSEPPPPSALFPPSPVPSFLTRSSPGTGGSTPSFCPVTLLVLWHRSGLQLMKG